MWRPSGEASMILERELVSDAHVHRFVVSTDETGWQVQEKEDATVIRHTHHTDWHRVERAVQLFDQTAITLAEHGWIERPTH
jgi:hypothetical protein